MYLGNVFPKFSIGTKVRKKSGSFWEGRVTGFYSTNQTENGYAVQLEIDGIDHPNMPVQIYPEDALELM